MMFDFVTRSIIYVPFALRHYMEGVLIGPRNEAATVATDANVEAVEKHVAVAHPGALMTQTLVDRKHLHRLPLHEAVPHLHRQKVARQKVAPARCAESSSPRLRVK